MEKHSVPQNLMDVEFKLFGPLTVRQFIFVALAAMAGVLIYTSGLAEIVRIPLTVMIISLGGAFAFLKVGEMTFASWLGNYVSNLFTSQRKVYSKSKTRVEYLNDDFASEVEVKHKGSDVQLTKPMALQGLQTKPFNQLAGTSVKVKNLEVEDPLAEEDFGKIDKYFANSALTQRKTVNSEQSSGDPVQVAGDSVQVAGDPAQVAGDPAQVAGDPAQATDDTTQSTLAKKQMSQDSAKLAQDSATQVNQQDQINHNRIQFTNTQLDTISNSPSIQLNMVSRAPGNMQFKSPKSASRFKIERNRQLLPNQISGFVVDSKEQPIVNAIAKLKLPDGTEIQTLRSDQNGKFISSELKNGRYKIEILATNLNFPEYEIELTGKLVPVYKYLPS